LAAGSGLAVDDPVQGAAVGFDHPPGAEVVFGAGDQELGEAEPLAHRLGLGEHLGGVAASSLAGDDVVADVAAFALQGRGEPVADDDRAQVVGPVHEPQLGDRDTPQLPDGAAPPDKAGEVGRRLLQPGSGKALLTRGLRLAPKVRGADQGGRRDQARQRALAGHYDLHPRGA
jgi:hypothetical protein